ncbi:MAG: response regulator transcription factor [Bacilli bacterium]|nr:response regulator transcription factor [Bacilli bacterium]
MKILIIEDEFNLADAIKAMLLKKKYDVTIKTDGDEGLDEALTNIYDLIILDVMLPGIDGFEILEELKNENIDSKVLMLTAKSTIEDKLTGLNNGADDYITKPFHMDELLARVNIQLRKNNKDNNIEIGNTVLDIDKLLLINKDTKEEVSIIGKEFQLLENFMNNLNQVLDKEQIFNKIWGYDSEVESNSLEAYLSFIRKKLKLINSNLNIKAVRNLGYKLEVLDEKTKS